MLITAITHASARDKEHNFRGLTAGSIEGDELASLAATGEVAHLLVSGHADLVKTLPESTRLRADAADGGWFQTRPVLFQIEIESGRPRSEATINFCEGMVDGSWRDLTES